MEEKKGGRALECRELCPVVLQAVGHCRQDQQVTQDADRHDEKDVCNQDNPPLLDQGRETCFQVEVTN